MEEKGNARLVVVCEGLGNVVYIRYNLVIDHEIEDGVLILPPVCYCIRELGIVVPEPSTE
jgi:hypothetical protein